MSQTLTQIRALVARRAVRISDHGYDELAKDGILANDVVAGVSDAVIVEDYPDAMRGPSVLVLQADAAKMPIHVVWAIPKEQSEPAVLVTAYRPDPRRWSPDLMRRRPQ